MKIPMLNEICMTNIGERILLRTKLLMLEDLLHYIGKNMNSFNVNGTQQLAFQLTKELQNFAGLHYKQLYLMNFVELATLRERIKNHG